MNAYWKIRRAIISLKRRIRFWLDKRKRAEKRIVGLPVYFEDTGERVGVVKKVIRNSLGEEIGYEIEDESGRAIYFPSDAFERSKRGLIFAPLWYSEGLKLVAELEAKTKMPDIHELILQGELGKEEMYRMVVKKYPEIRKYVEEVLLLKESLMSRINDLEMKILKLRRELVDLSGKRLLKEIGRKEFAEKVIEARREMRIAEIGIKRCRELLLRIDKIPFLPKKMEEEEFISIRKLLHSIPVGIVILDENCRVIGANEHVEAHFGYSKEEMVGKYFTEFVVVKDREKIMDANERIFEGSESEEIEFEFVDSYGVHHILYGRFTGMSQDGERISVLALQSKEEAKGLKKIFSERVAHLFLNPLSIAQGYLHLLNEEKYGELTDEQKKQLVAIEKSLRRIEKLVKETIKLQP